MISATSLNASNALNKGPQIPLGLDNGRMRVDSQKFLVPSLPVSARALSSHHNSDPKRRERSIVNGTAHTHPPSENHYSHHQSPHHHLTINHSYQNHTSSNGMRSPYGPHGGNGTGGNSASPHNNNSPNNNPRSSSHHPYSHLNSSPRKDAHSPMYAVEVPGLSPGGNYPSRSSMPIPCSSPAQASSASPKSSHSHSPSSVTTTGGNYSPKLPSGPAMLPPPPTGTSDLSSLAAVGRLYPGFPAPHPSVAAHLTPAFYAAAAAAHSIPFPLFGHYNHHTHSHSAAAASAYLDSFHSAIMNRGTGEIQQQQQQQQRSRSPSPQPPSSRGSHGPFHHAQPHPQQQQSQSNHHGQSTSVTSFHNKLIESTSDLSDRHGFNGHHHAHHNSSNSGRYSPGSLGISKGGPLGISGGIMNLPSSRLSNGQSPQKVPQAENLIVNKSTMNGYHGPPKGWIEHPGLVLSASERKIVNEMESNDLRNKIIEMHKESSLKHRMLTRSPEEIYHPPSKVPKTLTFTNDVYPMHSNNLGKNIHHIPNPYANINGHHHPSNIGILTDSNNAKKQVNNSNQQSSHYHQQLQQHQQQVGNNPPPTFLPPSPKKRSGNWNFAVPANPLSKIDLPPPPPPPPLSNLHHSVQNSNVSVHREPSKYLNLNQNPKPSNHHHSLPVPNSFTTSIDINSNKTTYLSSGQSAQHSPYPLSPSLKKPGSGPSTPKSPSVHQVKFAFSSDNSKENINGLRNVKSTRNDSSSSTSSNEGTTVPWPVEQMPLIEAFRRGSLIKLANGDLRPVEELLAEDFIHAAANMTDSLRIIHCTVLSIQGDTSNGKSLCKVIMAIGSQVQNQQVIVPSTPEQPYFVLGRGWSSLSPKTTEKLLGLPCSPLNVGDVCITLSKTNSSNKANNNGRSQNTVPKSPLTKTRGNGPKSRLAATTTNSTNTANATIKRSLQPPQTSVTLKSTTISAPENKSSVSGQDKTLAVLNSSSNVVKSTSVIPTPVKNCMGPPTITPIFLKSVPLPPSDVTSMSKDNVNDNLLGPPSPKKRRWSAPEPEMISTPVSPKDLPDKTKNVSSSPPPPIVSLNSCEIDKRKADMNSNMTLDAQTAKA